MANLRELATVIRECTWSGPDGDREITGIQYNSGEVVPGSLFACLRGRNSDGHDFIGDAIDRGAIAFLTEKPVFILIRLSAGMACLKQASASL